MFEQVDSPTFIDITVIHIALYLLILVLLGNNRLRALISASFAFSIINLAHLPISHFIFFVVSPFINSLSYVEFIQKNPNIYYSSIFLNNVVIAVCCLFAARWLREIKLKPPLILYVIFNLLFVLFPLAILAWYEDILNIMSVPFLTSAFIGTFFLVIMLFIFYLYTRLAADNLTADLNVTERPLSLKAEKNDKYVQFIQRLSRRELEVIEAILAGNVRHKQLSAALNISVSTVKTHLIHIYQTTGVSGITALSLLFHGYTPQTPKNQP
ncbi:MAG: LuxR C-terminal-related transcriptional regulator [Treponema sp.]|jgi:DNA-binding CsgD family transcriptional regulator|nr:LuxR C-terminal-related transcriptional regulator [Treponema sp.]